MKSKRNFLRMEGMLVILMFGVFAVLILAVLFTGAGAYQRIVERGQEAFLNRTLSQYVITKVHQSDVEGAISVTEWNGLETLEIREEIDGEVYLTRIYCYEGQLRELFTAQNVECSPVDGESVLEAKEASFERKNGRLSIDLLNRSGERIRVSVQLRSQGGEINEK